MPEFPDVCLYVDALNRFVVDRKIETIVIRSPFVLKTFEPDIHDFACLTVTQVSRLGKQIVFHLERNHYLVFHLMVAGRFHWRKPGAMAKSKNELASFGFEHGTLMYTEASQKKRAAVFATHGADSLAEFDRNALNLLDCSVEDFTLALHQKNSTVKRALTDPSRFDGIGNAYSDEILLHSELSPFLHTGKLDECQIRSLLEACRFVLTHWTEKLIDENGNRFPEKVTAFRDGMLAHGRFGKPCVKCDTTIQRIRFNDREINYCPKCQTKGKILADRSLSRLLGDEWPSYNE